VTQVFGEVYHDNLTYPSLNGTVSGYLSGGGGHLNPSTVNSPYSISNSTDTGFTASGPSGGQPTSAGYSYVAKADTTVTTNVSVNLPIKTQTVASAPAHSLFELSMSNQFGASGNIIECGITTDPLLNGDNAPHWFVYSWINGTPQGYDGVSGFTSEIGNFWNTPLDSLDGTSSNVAFIHSPVPEPSTLTLLGFGAIILLRHCKLRRKI
jgi:hypothetical protein